MEWGWAVLREGELIFLGSNFSTTESKDLGPASAAGSMWTSYKPSLDLFDQVPNGSNIMCSDSCMVGVN